MNINFTNKSTFRKMALSSILLPLLSFNQAYATEEQTPLSSAISANVTNDVAISSPSEKSKQSLMTKLGKLAFFSANFNQKILNEQGEVLQKGAGSLAISKPNLVNWKTTSPDETLIVSDGNTLWFFDPFIEQASAYSLAKSIHNTPILLLTSDEPKLWQQYTVVEMNVVEMNVIEGDVEKQKNSDNKGLRYVVIPKDETSQIKKLTLSFTEKTVNEVTLIELSQFSFEDATGQVSQIILSNFNSQTKPAAALFTFNLPEGVRLEDKR